MQIHVRVESAGLERTLVRLHRDQLPFAVSLGINRSALAAQDAQRRHQRSVFVVRRPLFVDRAVKIKPFATKTRLEAVIMIDPPGGQARADVLTKFEAGGIKRPRTGRSLTIPKDVRPSITVVVPRDRRPRAYQFRLRGVGRGGIAVYQGNRRTFMIRRLDGGGVILQRIGRGDKGRREGGRDPNVRLLYRLVPRSTIDDRLEFVETVSTTVRVVWPEKFVEAFRQAVATARS